MSSCPSLVLRSGAKMPQVGLGTWKAGPGVVASVVEEALRAGYRHLDCACDYGNEHEVGQGIKAAIDAGVCKREDIFVTSKLWNTYHHKEHVRPACERTLKDLGLDYIDLYLIHFPISLKFVPFEKRYPPEWIHDPEAANPKMEVDPVPLSETWAAMEELVDAGLVKDIGVSNFNCQLLADLLSYARIKPSVNQVELHPYLTQEFLVRFCKENGVVVTGYSPFGALSYASIGMAKEEESVLNNEVIGKIGEKHGKSPAQVSLRWACQRGYTVVPKSANIDRLKQNLNVFDFELSQEEMEAISGLNRNRRYNDPGVFTELAFNTFYPIHN
ncbi:aldehyde reductase [Salpingoeca rosetta]|uniref:Aldehyde reductase n=1 Tax=Salpingoeca rosetta (strain ATCC 50818 / BSB-021) TaxID=946362 RepID=F2UPA8_SALR5|nr:aldehyde reductase [Salpingoeca rosetta]EGD79463.1 aldehyde reductase [Salpingoeca rosetta]|eukprot:XP_004988944.1 aldehyde reductase [Salpingoeca rosetta]